MTVPEKTHKPEHIWWRCVVCGLGNGPRDDKFCRGCGRDKTSATDRPRWQRFLADAVIDKPDLIIIDGQEAESDLG